MTDFTFEGDLQSATKQQLDFICEVLKKKGFKGSKVTIEPLGKAGDNYIANLKRITVNEDGRTLKLVAKLAPENPVLREVAQFDQLFQNEHIMYTQILPKFDQIQKTAGVPENERFRFAKCYGSMNEAPNEVILLEDLKEDNFEILSRFEPFSYENVKLVLKNFAIYHALSFVTRYQEPDTYSRFQKLLEPNLNVEIEKERFEPYANMIESEALACADARCERFLKGAVTKMIDLNLKMRKLIKGSKHSVIQMGDAWTNNIMFRHENNKAVECVLVDYQMVRENSPVFDLMFMLFNSTSHEDRMLHFYEYLDFYHNELDKALQNFGLKANFVYPKDRLDADLKSYGKLMFAQSIMSASLSTKKNEDAQRMRDLMDNVVAHIGNDQLAMETLKLRDDESTNMLKVRVEGLADSFAAFGLI